MYIANILQAHADWISYQNLDSGWIKAFVDVFDKKLLKTDTQKLITFLENFLNLLRKLIGKIILDLLELEWI